MRRSASSAGTSTTPAIIDNVPGTRTFPTSGITINNDDVVKNNYNDVDTFGGRAALKIDLDDNWTITPSIMAQEQNEQRRVRLRSAASATWRSRTSSPNTRMTAGARRR